MESERKVCSAREQEGRNQRKVLSRGREKNKQESRFFGESGFGGKIMKKSRVAKMSNGLLDLTEDVWVRGRGVVVVMEVVPMVVIMVIIMLLWV